jgi:iron complex outermembrane receptor protein
MKTLLAILCALSTAGALADTGAPASALSEQDFLAEMPIVLSVSRLAQRIDETPGAVTILDREFIRMTGARDVADLLRFVPGFQTTTSFETDAPMASYHGRNDDFSNRLQVLVDGRSVYSGFFMGSVGVGLQTLAIDDIERIEVLRGSNSAAYGARAFLGVINIISRDVRETVGSAGSVTGGDNGVADASARVGWGDPEATYRMSADTRGDNGLRGAFGKNQIDRFNFSSHFAPQAGQDLFVRAGGVNIEAGRGTPGDVGNDGRMRYMGSRFVQMDWSTPLGFNQDLLITASHTENNTVDRFPYLSNNAGLANYGLPLDFSGQDYNDAVTLQSTDRHSPTLRTVWGAEVRREQVVSPSAFDGRGQVTTDFVRFFGNAEWRMSPALILNAGLMAEHSDIGGDSASPRIMLNWHVANGHTLRAGISNGFRPPSAYEKYALVRYYGFDGSLLQTTVDAKGNVGPERINSHELGYNWSVPTRGFSADLRMFNERITDGIASPYNDPYGTDAGAPVDYVNLDNYTITGSELQLTWRPSKSTEVFTTHSWTDISGVPDAVSLFDTHSFRVAHGAPHYAGALTVMHTFDSGVALSLMHQRADDTALMSNGGGNPLFSMGRTDIRVAKAFRIGSNKAELAVTGQNLDVPYRDGDRKYFFDTRTFVTLRIEN